MKNTQPQSDPQLYADCARSIGAGLEARLANTMDPTEMQQAIDAAALLLDLLRKGVSL